MSSAAYETQYDVIIIGAGLYGLAFANTWLKVHPEARLVILEACPCLGGVWSSERMYDAFWTQTPLDMACFSDFPMQQPQMKDETYYDFFPAKYVTQYLERFVDNKIYAGKSLRQRIIFSSPVHDVWKNKEGGWHILHSDKQSLSASKLVVAAGLTSQPNMPRLPGHDSYDGTVLHHKDFGSSSILTNPEVKHVAVLGGAKSAADMAYACAKAGKAVSWVIRATGSGPAAFASAQGIGPYKNSNELLYTRLAASLNPSVWMPRRWMESLLHGTAVGRQLVDRIWAKIDADARRPADYDGRWRHSVSSGFANLKPDTPIFWQNDSTGVNQRPDFWDLIAQKVKVYRQDIVKLEGSSIVLTKDKIEADVLICATGWRPSHHSFIDTSLANDLGLPTSSDLVAKPVWEDLDVAADLEILARFPRLRDPPSYHSPSPSSSPFRLYKYMLPTSPTYRDILFLGHIAVGNNFRAAEVQALWATAYFDEHLHTSSQAHMENEVALGVAWCRRRYLSKGELGHWLYYDLVPYTDALLEEVGVKGHRKTGTRDFWSPCVAEDLKGLLEEYLVHKALQGR
ncbi:monooxygenase [Xylographa bjoerkii]|nr:monooxygenase [Xylographa bjoerkii]